MNRENLRNKRKNKHASRPRATCLFQQLISRDILSLLFYQRVTLYERLKSKRVRYNMKKSIGLIVSIFLKI